MDQVSTPSIGEIPSPSRSPLSAGVDAAAGLITSQAGRRLFSEPTNLEIIFVETTVSGALIGIAVSLGSIAAMEWEGWARFAAVGIAMATASLATISIVTCLHMLRNYQDRAAAIIRRQRATIHFWRREAEERGRALESALSFAGEAGRGRGQSASPAADAPNVIRPTIWER